MNSIHGILVQLEIEIFKADDIGHITHRRVLFMQRVENKSVRVVLSCGTKFCGSLFLEDWRFFGVLRELFFYLLYL